MLGGEEQERIITVRKDSQVQLEPCLSDSDKANKKHYWISKLRGIKCVVAPMVDQSELAFRMMMRRHGAHLCYTPMIHAHLFVTDSTYRRTALSSCLGDRPLIVQFCANDPDMFLQACKLVEGFCDGVDLNLGCPQLIAKRGHYGSYLQEDRELVCRMVASVHQHCSLPLSCKIRILDDINDTVEYAKSLVDAGACMLTVHGRTREQRGPNTGLADWEAVGIVRGAVDVPVLANGNIQLPNDVERCLDATGVAAVMSAEGVLTNPYLFEGRHEANWTVGREYLDYAERYKASLSAIRAHLFRICNYSLLEYADLREKMTYVCTLPEFREILNEIERRVKQSADFFDENADCPQTASTCTSSFASYISSLPHWICKPYLRPQRNDTVVSQTEYRERRRAELEVLAEQTGLSKRQIRKREKRKIEDRKTQSKKQTYPKCLRCSMPASQGCKYLHCRNCCRYKTAHERLDCKAHHFQFLSKEPRCARNENLQLLSSSLEIVSDGP